MRDTVQHFCEKHLDKIKAYMDNVSLRIPPPAKCTIEGKFEVFQECGSEIQYFLFVFRRCRQGKSTLKFNKKNLIYFKTLCVYLIQVRTLITLRTALRLLTHQFSGLTIPVISLATVPPVYGRIL